MGHSERLRCRLSKNIQTFNKFLVWKKILMEGRCVREVSREFGPWFFFSPTYFGEISIFGLSKDPATRNWSILMNPEQFLILVTYLLRCGQPIHKSIAKTRFRGINFLLKVSLQNLTLKWFYLKKFFFSLGDV